jgi:hypothetical protein
MASAALERFGRIDAVFASLPDFGTAPRNDPKQPCHPVPRSACGTANLLGG